MEINLENSKWCVIQKASQFFIWATKRKKKDWTDKRRQFTFELHMRCISSNVSGARCAWWRETHWMLWMNSVSRKTTEYFIVYKNASRDKFTSFIQINMGKRVEKCCMCIDLKIGAILWEIIVIISTLAAILYIICAWGSTQNLPAGDKAKLDEEWEYVCIGNALKSYNSHKWNGLGSINESHFYTFLFI